MHKLIILSTLILSFFSCSVKEKPEFLKVENIKIKESSDEFITLTANAYFKNPNIVGGKLATEGISIFVNDVLMAQVASEEFKVPAKKEFSVPLEAKIPTDRILDKKNLGGLLNSLLKRKIKVQYKGIINYKVLGFSDTYDVDRTEEVKIKL